MSTTDRTDDESTHGPERLHPAGDERGATVNECPPRLLIHPYAGKPFALHGVVGGRAVSAETVDATIVLDEELFVRARRLADDQVCFELPNYQRSFRAVVDGDEPAVALTLLRCFDRIRSIRMSLDVG